MGWRLTAGSRLTHFRPDDRYLPRLEALATRRKKNDLVDGRLPA